MAFFGLYFLRIHGFVMAIVHHFWYVLSVDGLKKSNAEVLFPFHSHNDPYPHWNRIESFSQLNMQIMLIACTWDCSKYIWKLSYLIGLMIRGWLVDHMLIGMQRIKMDTTNWFWNVQQTVLWCICADAANSASHCIIGIRQIDYRANYRLSLSRWNRNGLYDWLIKWGNYT